MTRLRVNFRRHLRASMAAAGCADPDDIRDTERLGPEFARFIRAAARSQHLLVRNYGQLTENSTVDQAVDFLASLWQAHTSKPACQRRRSTRRPAS